MTLSIIIPSFNQQEYLPDAIESVLQQRGSEHTELIIIDDGSTDKSLEVAKRYERKGLKIISQVNKGLASARNSGIMNARYDWVLPLDADDILMDDAVEKILKAIDKNPDADIIAPSFKEFGMRQTEIILMDNPTLEDFKTANRIGYFSAIRKSKLLEVGGYSPKMVFGYEDYHLWINLLSTGARLITLPDVLVLYRTKKESMITTAQEHHEELMAQISKDFFKEKI